MATTAARPARSTDPAGIDDLLTGVSGVLPRQAIARLIAEGAISSRTGDPGRNLQPASLDLTLGPVAYRLRSSFLPGRERVLDKLRDYQMGEIDLERGAVLEQGRPYLVPLNESLRLPGSIRGRANPRSSTGRIDVFTRVVTDYGHHFDEIPFGHDGPLFLEVVPRSFTIKVTSGMRLNQLRLVAGTARLSDAELLDYGRENPLVYPGASTDAHDVAKVSDGLFLSVDLSGAGRSFAGYRARKSSALLDLARTGSYHVTDFFERVEPRNGRLILDQEEFYLLVSRERVRIPPDLAAEMAAYDPTSGELRTHYAGFFDPGFGDVPPGEIPGTPAVLEVRAHDVAFALEHGQRLCKLTFERMADRPDQLYGTSIGSRYQRQSLTLGRQFRPDPKGAKRPTAQRLPQQPLPLESVEPDPYSSQPLVIEARE